MSRHSEKRTAILDGATEVFRTEGFDNASMDRVAEVAGVSKRTVYNHFGSKEALFEAVVQSLIDALSQLKAVAWNPGASLESQLAAFARAKSAAVSDPKWLSLTRVALALAIQRPAFARETMVKAMAGEECLVDWLKEAHAAGRLNVPNPPLAASLFWSMVSGAVFWPAVFDLPTSSELPDAVGEVIETFLARFRPR